MSGRRVESPGSNGSLAALGSQLVSASGHSTRALAALFGLVPVSLVTLYRVVHNAPGDLAGGVAELATLWVPVAIVGPALGAFVLAATAETSHERVGCAFVGGFGLLALASPAAWYPAAIGVVVGGGIVVGGGVAGSGGGGGGGGVDGGGDTSIAGRSRVDRLDRDHTAVAAGELGVVALLVCGVVLSLAATAGVVPATARPLGSAATLVGIGSTPVLVGWDEASLSVGAFAALLTFGFVTSAPYVAGAVLLVGGGVVGAPLALVLLGVGGGVAAFSHALVERRTALAAGVALLLAAGVPSTLLGATSVVLAVAVFATALRGEHA